MAMVLANGKKAKLLEQKRTFLNTLTYKLFVNNHVPVAGDTAGAYTECTDGGYAAKTNMGFTAAYLNALNQGETDAPVWTNTFTLSGGAFTVYGYYVIDPADGALVYAEANGGGFLVSAAGTQYSVAPLMLDDTM